MQVSTHPAELCPVHESKYRAITVNWYEKIESLAAKHGMKFIGSYNDHYMHDVYVLYDTPDMNTFMEFSMEPEMMVMANFCKTRVFPVFDHKTTLSIIKK